MRLRVPVSTSPNDVHVNDVRHPALLYIHVCYFFIIYIYFYFLDFLEGKENNVDNIDNTPLVPILRGFLKPTILEKIVGFRGFYRCQTVIRR